MYIVTGEIHTNSEDRAVAISDALTERPAALGVSDMDAFTYDGYDDMTVTFSCEVDALYPMQAIIDTLSPVLTRADDTAEVALSDPYHGDYFMLRKFSGRYRWMMSKGAVVYENQYKEV